MPELIEKADAEQPLFGRVEDELGGEPLEPVRELAAARAARARSISTPDRRRGRRPRMMTLILGDD